MRCILLSHVTLQSRDRQPLGPLPAAGGVVNSDVPLECDMVATQTQQKCFGIVTCKIKGPHPPTVHPTDSFLVPENSLTYV